MSDVSKPDPDFVVPEKPALEGLEERWRARWEAEGTYRFDRTSPREAVFAIDTPPPTGQGRLLSDGMG